LVKILEPALDMGLSYLTKMTASLADLVMDFHSARVMCGGKSISAIVLLQTLLNRGMSAVTV
jgi:hypothetical protein